SALDPPPQTLTPSYYRHAIGVFDEIHDADVSRNLIYDTKPGSAPSGKYAFYMYQRPASTNIRVSQNTVRVTASSGLHSFQTTSGLVDASNANDLLIAPVTSSPLSVDFMSFRQYLITINT